VQGTEVDVGFVEEKLLKGKDEKGGRKRPFKEVRKACLGIPGKEKGMS